MENISVFSELASDRNKYEGTIMFIIQLIMDTIIAFWIAGVFGYSYNGDEITMESFIRFISSYEVLIPITSLFISYALFRVLYPFTLNLISYKIHHNAFFSDTGFLQFLSKQNLYENPYLKDYYEIRKPMLDSILCQSGQDKLLNQATLFLSITVILIGCCPNISWWLLIPFTISLTLTILHVHGYSAYRVLYLRKDKAYAIIEAEIDRLERASYSDNKN